MTTHEEMPSVQTAVDLEARRRKRVFVVFLALLTIPVAIGVYAIAKAPSETEAVARSVAPIVEKDVFARVDRQIEPRVEELVAKRATPVIQQALERQLDTRVDRVVTTRIQPLEQSVRMFAREGNPEQRRMAARVKELEARVASLEQRLAALSDTRAERPVLTHVPKKPQ